MSLPDLALQIVYGRLAWALVAAALLLALLPAMRISVGQRARSLIVAAIFVVMALPGAASPAYWLALALQYPSGLLVGCSVVSLLARWRGRRVRYTLPAGLALGLSVIGLVVYLDTFGILALGLYYGGFNPVAAPLLACAAAIGYAVNVWRGGATGPSAAMLIAVLLFSLLRLPTGNLWDALLDPLLWSWALGSAIIAAMRMAAARRVVPATQPAAVPDLVPDLAPVRATAAK